MLVTDKKSTPITADSKLSGVRVARVSTVPFFVATQLKKQLMELGNAGAQVTVVTSSGPELNLLGGLPGVRCVPITIRRNISPWHDLKALVALVRLFRQEKIQIAHSTTPKAGLLTALAAFIAGVPIRLHTFTGQPWVNMRGLIKWLARNSDWLIGKFNTRCYADSPTQRDFLIDQQVVNAHKLRVIGYGSLAGVDTERFSRDRFSANEMSLARESLGIPAEATVIIFLGRITIDKGVNELVQAFKEIKGLGSAAHLLLAGQFDNQSGVSENITEDEIKYVHDIHVLGYAERPEEYLAIADILCLPSHREGFGTVVIEAAAMGVPTVGTNIYGLSDAVVHGETGLLVPPRDASALASALLLLINDKELRLRMGLAAKMRTENIFSAIRVNKLLLAEYRSLLISMK
jgi:glycosyltransferase involved in cell wall biosynthesis